MHYSSPLISSKLWAEPATYVRQLCKISDRAHVQNLTGRELQDNDGERERERERMTGGGRNNKRHIQWEETSYLHVLCCMSSSEARTTSTDPSKASGQRHWRKQFPPSHHHSLKARDIWGLFKVRRAEQRRGLLSQEDSLQHHLPWTEEKKQENISSIKPSHFLTWAESLDSWHK